MKLNFWQWIGIICLVGGAIGYIWFKDRDKKPERPTPAPVQTEPADRVSPTTQPAAPEPLSAAPADEA